LDGRFVRNVLIKAALLFAALNLLFAAVQPLPALGTLSAYNRLFPGRQRFPFGEDPQQAYNLSLYSVEAMFAAHEISAAPKDADEFRVLVVGDSSTWGTLLKPQETLAGQLTAMQLTAADGRAMRFYNLGYPTLSLTKDVMILEEARRYQPDLVVWLVTLEAFPREKQLASPLVANNAARIDDLAQQYNLSIDPADPALIRPELWGSTLIGQRRALADLLRLQLYGVLWAATGIDQVYPPEFPPAQRDLEADESFYNRTPPTLEPDSLALDALGAGMQAAGAPVLLVNEPVMISSGANSDIRYNFYYPRWAYDQYRELLEQLCRQGGWQCLDVWNLAPEEEFTNSAIHLTPHGVQLLAQRVAQEIQLTR